MKSGAARRLQRGAAEWTEVMEVKSILSEGSTMRGGGGGVRRDMDENPPLRAGTDMIMGARL